MKYIATFIIAAVIGAHLEQPHYTMTNGCVSIKVPTAIYHDALDAGLFDWMDMQCEVAS